MRFQIRKHRSPPAVIIVALIDVLVVLLIFLMVTTTFKQQPALKVALPESSSVEKEGVGEPPPLRVNIDTNGNFRLGDKNLPMTPDQLRTELLAQAAKNPALKLAIRADKKAPWESIVKVMDIARDGHIKTLSAAIKTAAKP